MALGRNLPKLLAKDQRWESQNTPHKQHSSMGFMIFISKLHFGRKIPSYVTVGNPNYQFTGLPHPRLDKNFLKKTEKFKHTVHHEEADTNSFMCMLYLWRVCAEDDVWCSNEGYWLFFLFPEGSNSAISWRTWHLEVLKKWAYFSQNSIIFMTLLGTARKCQITVARAFFYILDKHQTQVLIAFKKPYS